MCFARGQIGGLTTRHFTSPFCFCDVNPLSGLIGLAFSTLLTVASLNVVRRKQWEYFYLMGHLQLLFPLLWAVLINNRVAVFPWCNAGTDAARWPATKFLAKRVSVAPVDPTGVRAFLGESSRTT